MKKGLHKRRRKFVGILLQVERKYLGYNQDDVAQMLGFSQEKISQIEASTRRIDIIELMDFCEVLNLSLVEFAAKIESRLFAEGLLQRRKRRIKQELCKLRIIRIDVSWCENSFTASFGDNVPGTVVFTADTFVGLRKEAAECLASHVDDMVADGVEVSQWLASKEYEFEYKFLDVASLLKAYEPYLSLAAISRVTGINQNLLSQYANGLKKAGQYQMKRIMDGVHKIGEELMVAMV